MLAGFALMTGSAAAGWSPGASGAWSLAFVAGAVLFAVCWASLTGLGRRSAERRAMIRGCGGRVTTSGRGGSKRRGGG